MNDEEFGIENYTVNTSKISYEVSVDLGEGEKIHSAVSFDKKHLNSRKDVIEKSISRVIQELFYKAGMKNIYVEKSKITLPRDMESEVKTTKINL